MLYGLVLTLLILDGLLLAVVVLLQAGQGGGLASLGGGTTDLVMGGRQAITILHTLSWWTGGIFLFLSLILSLLASRSSVGVSDVQQRLRTAPAPVAPAPLNQQPAAPPAPGTTPPAGTARPTTPEKPPAGGAKPATAEKPAPAAPAPAPPKKPASD